MSNKEKIAEGLDEVFPDGKAKIRVLMPKQFLANLTDILSKQNEKIAANLDNRALLADLIEENKKSRALMNELLKAIRDNKIERVEVANFPEPKEIKFPEQKEIKIPEFPKEVEIKKPSWYEKFVPDKILEYLGLGFKQTSDSFAAALDRHKELENALAVRLVDKDLKTFYTAIFAGASAYFPSNFSISNFPTDYPDANLLAFLNQSCSKVSGQKAADGELIAAAGLTTKIRIRYLFLNNADTANSGEAKLLFGGGGGTEFYRAWLAKDGGLTSANLVQANVLSGNNENVYLDITTTTKVNYVIYYTTV